MSADTEKSIIREHVSLAQAHPLLQNASNKDSDLCPHYDSATVHTQVCYDAMRRDFPTSRGLTR